MHCWAKRYVAAFHLEKGMKLGNDTKLLITYSLTLMLYTLIETVGIKHKKLTPKDSPIDTNILQKEE